MKKEYIAPAILLNITVHAGIMAGSDIPYGTPTNDKKPNEAKYWDIDLFEDDSLD